MRWTLLLVPCAAWISRPALPARGRRPSLARASTATREDGLVFAPDDAASVVDAKGVASLGMPRVARYMRDDDSARYVMWFQARDDSINEEVVPLSTGRVFRAESFDGRSWRALAGDELNGAAILSTSEDWWTFDTAHVGLGDVMLSSNANVRGGEPDYGTYFMYYFGGSMEAEPLAEFMPAGAGVDPAKAVTGMRLRIGVAVSQDGAHWSRLEGEHPSGACLDVGAAGDFDATFVGWPQVVPLPEQDKFRLYYHALDRESGRYAIGVAESKDGLKFEKLGGGGSGGETRKKAKRGAAPVFEASGVPGAFDERGVARRHVLPPDAAGGGSAAWRMFYEGVSARNTHAVGLATSVDGLTWERANGGLPVFEPSADEGAWDARAVGSPHVVRDGLDADAPLLMFYAGNGNGESKAGAIGLAISDDEGLSWRRVKHGE